MLFLNKTDVLQRKLASGVRFSDFVPSFDDQGGKKNNYESVIRCEFFFLFLGSFFPVGSVDG